MLLNVKARFAFLATAAFLSLAPFETLARPIGSTAVVSVGRWTSKAPMPVAMAEVGVGEVDGKIYVVGGTEQRGKGPPIWASKVTLMYDPASDRWTERAPLPIGLSHAGVAAVDGKLYAVGGFTTPVHIGPKSVAFAYDPRANRWQRIADISSARGSIATVSLGGKLHIFGGRISTEIVKLPVPPGTPPMSQAFGLVTTHQIYDPATGRWSSGAPEPDPARDHVGVVVFDGKVHLFGGRTRDVVDNLARHDVYDPRTDSWSTAAPLPKPRSSGAFTVLDGKIIYAGGECRPGGKPGSLNTFSDVTAYDPSTDSWSTLKPLPQARHAFGAATIGGVSYFIGGATTCGGGTSRNVFALQLEEPSTSRPPHVGRSTKMPRGSLGLSKGVAK